MRVWYARSARLVHAVTRFDVTFAGLMVLLVMGLAIMSIPYAGYFVLLGAASAGALVAIAKIRRAARRAEPVPTGKAGSAKAE